MNEQQGFSIDTLELGPMENFVYLIQDHNSGRAAVVDPAWDVDRIIELARQRDVQITDILLTHSHHDHINGIEELLGHYDAQMHLTHAEARFWDRYLDLPTLHHGGDVITLGDTEIKVLHTPGHTPGSACYHVGDQLIAGDTLFVFGCGRCDLNGGDPEQMYHTLQHLRNDLPASTILLPGHNYAVKPTSTLEEQVQGNPFMHFHDNRRFAEYRMHVHDRIRHDPYGPVSQQEVDELEL